ncbi:MAG: PAS domain S-box protein, partial [Planctomycetales bacterium]|nr:PAS domain S-box protein [Planctomycetales bacterium]
MRFLTLKTESKLLMWAAVLAAALAVFFIDTMLELEITASILYLPVIAATFGMPGTRPILVLASFCSILACVDLYVSPAGDQPLFDLANCLLSVFSIWLTAALCVRIKQSERRLTARNRYCIAVVDTALDAIVSMDADGRVIDWNPQAERLLGWSKQQALGASVADLVIPATHRDAHQLGLRRYLETGESSVLGKRIEMTALTNSGSEVPVEISISALRQESGVTFNAFLRDVSERRELALYRARMAALVESSFDAIISKDLERTIKTWNSGAEEVYGYTEEEAVGQPISILFPEGMKEEEPEIQEAKQEGRQLVRFETVRRRKNGELVDVSLTLSP